MRSQRRNSHRSLTATFHRLANNDGGNCRHGLKCQSGFSLLEVLVAFAILSISLGVLYQAFSNSLRNVAAVDHYTRAMIIAESQLAEAVSEMPIREGKDQGEVDDTYRWEVTVTQYEEADERLDKRGQFDPFQIEVEVSWGDRRRPRAYQLSTLRLTSAR